MEQLAATIRKRLDRLAQQYDRRLCAIDGFASLGETDRRDAARRELDVIAGCLEAGDASSFPEYVSAQAAARTQNGCDNKALMQALDALEETLMPLVSNVKAARFLWRAFSQARTALCTQAVASPHTPEEQQGLLTERERVLNIVETSPDFIAMATANGHVFYVNPAGLAMTGYTPEDLQAGMVIADWQPTLPREALETASREGTWSGEAEFYHKDGRVILTSQVITAVKDEAGDVQAYTTISRDITQEKKAAERLQQLARAVEATHDAVVITDMRGVIQFVNPAFEQITGYSREEAIGQNPRILKSGFQSKELYAEMWRTISAGEVWEGDMTNRRKDGTLYHARLTISPIRGATGEIEQFVAIQHDVTAQKQTEQRVAALLERRAEQVQTATEVAQEIAAAPALDELFRRVVTLVKERFDYYHVQIFRYDPDIDAVVLVAGYGEVGAKMLAAGHRLAMGHGVVGTAASSGKPVLAANVAQDAYWVPNPHLPDTKGELAVPIKLRDEVLGILDIQSDAAGALTEEDQISLEGLCGQIAIAIGSTRLLEQVQQNADLLRTLIDNIPDFIYVKDRGARFTLLNAAALRDLNMASQEGIIGKTDFDLFPEELAAQYYAVDQRVMQSGVSIINREEPSYNMVTGERRWYSTTKVPVRDRQGQVVGLVGLTRDITEQKQVAARLTEERNLLRTVIDNIPDLIYAKDVESRFTLANRGILEQFGASTVDEVVGKTDFDFHPKEFAEQYYADEQEIIHSGRPLINHEEASVDRVTGDITWYASTKAPLRDAHGNIVGLVGIGRDITESKRAEARRAEERNLLRTLIDNLPDNIFVKDTEGRVILDNPAHRRLLGVTTQDESVGKTDFDFFPADMAAQYFADEQAIMRSRQPLINREEPTVDPDGNTRWLSTTKAPFYDSQGNIAGIVGINHDITDQKQTEVRLAEERNLLRTLIDTLPDLVYVKDAQCRFLLVNEIHARRLGEDSAEAVIGKTDFDYYPREMAEAFFADDQQVMQSGEPITREEPGKDQDGRPRWMLTTKVPLRDSHGRAIGLVGIGRDITERRSAEAEMQDRLAEINALYRAMSREGWESYREAAELTTGYLFDHDEVRPAADLWEPEIALAATREALVSATNGQGKVVAPLAVRGGEIIGALGVYDDPEHPLSKEDLALVQSVSEQVALALDAARLFGQTQATLQETDVLYKASQALGAAENEQALLEAVARYGLDSGAASATLSYIHTSERGEPEWLELAAACFGEGVPKGDTLIGTRVRVTAMPAAYLWVSDPAHPLVFSDAAVDPRLPEEMRASLTQQGARAAVMLPLQPGRRWVGLVSLNWSEPQAFTERDKRIYQALLDQAAVALDSRRLLAESTRRAEAMRFLFNVTQAATSSAADLESSMYSVAGLLRAFLNDAHTDILVPDKEEENALRLMACSHFLKPAGTLHPREMTTAVGWVAETLEPIFIDDVEAADRRFSDLLPETRSAVVLPIATGGQLNGMIRIQSEQPNVFNAHVVQLLQTLAGALHAIIQNQRLLQEVTAANERLLELDKLKSQFLANMSHELRTPLNSIIGFSRVMLKGIDGPLTDLQKQDLETIHSSGQHLLGLINNILDQSKIEAGKMELTCDYFQIGDVIKGVMSTAVALVKEKPIELIQQVPADLPPAWGDEFRTRQVLLNLVSNAGKFTDQGSITVSVETTVMENGVEMMLISVKDTGIGIAEKDMVKLFQAFQQVDASMTRKVGGTGLGLPIAKSLVEMQGGHIWVKSEVGVGSVFSFSIPLQPPPAQEEEAEEPAEPTPSLVLEAVEGKPKRPPRIVLVLDDEAGVINLYRRYLGNRGYAVVGTTDPDALESMIAEHHPDMVLLDVIMPNRDGWEVLRSLKSDPKTCDIPVVVCTIVDEPERGLEMGAAEYLVKPFVEDDLVAAVQRVEESLVEVEGEPSVSDSAS